MDVVKEEEEKDLIHADKERHFPWGRGFSGGIVDREEKESRDVRVNVTSRSDMGSLSSSHSTASMLLWACYASTKKGFQD